jgi:hypothetical protein
VYRYCLCFWNPKVSQILRLVLFSILEEIMDVGGFGGVEDSEAGKMKNKAAQAKRDRKKSSIWSWKRLNFWLKLVSFRWMRILPATPGAPWFKGPNILRFIKVVDGFSGVVSWFLRKKKLDYLVDFCSDSISIWLMSLVDPVEPRASSALLTESSPKVIPS